MTSEGKMTVYDMSRRGGAVAEVVLTCRHLAEREQCHTVTCWWINNKLRPLFLPKKKKNLWLLYAVSPLLTLSLPGNVLLSAQFFAPVIIFLPCPLFLSLLLAFLIFSTPFSSHISFLAPLTFPLRLLQYSVLEKNQSDQMWGEIWVNGRSWAVDYKT